MSLVRDAMDTMMGLAGLLVMLGRSRFRPRSPYWAWRASTAWGASPPGTRAEMIAALLAYARWTRRMRRLGRSG